MTNPYLEYYSNQAGSGLSAFEGLQYQRGHGFFGTIFQNIIKPLGKYLGRQALTTGVNVGNDILEGENFKDSIIKNSKMTSKKMLFDGVKKAQKLAQSGAGRRRRRRNKKKLIKKPINKIVKKKTKTVKRKRRRSKKKNSKLTSKFSNLFI